MEFGREKRPWSRPNTYIQCKSRHVNTDHEQVAEEDGMQP